MKLTDPSQPLGILQVVFPRVAQEDIVFEPGKIGHGVAKGCFPAAVVPNIRRLAIMADATFAQTMLEMNTVQALARKFGIDSIPLEIRRTEDIEPAFARLKSEQADALYVVINELLNANRLLIVTSAEAARLPSVYGTRDWVQSGGLISYGPNFPSLFARLAEITDKILRGAKPEDIPVEQPTRFVLAVNLKTSKAIEVPIPEAFLARADEVIE